MNDDRLFQALFGNTAPRLVYIENVTSSVAFYGDNGKMTCTKCRNEAAVISLMICKPDFAIGRLCEWAEQLAIREAISQNESSIWVDVLSEPMSMFEFQRQEFLCSLCARKTISKLNDLSHYDY